MGSVWSQLEACLLLALHVRAAFINERYGKFLRRRRAPSQDPAYSAMLLASRKGQCCSSIETRKVISGLCETSRCAPPREPAYCPRGDVSAAGLSWSFRCQAGRTRAGEITVQTFTHASAPSREPAYSAMPRGPREGECCCSKLVISISIEDDRLVSASPRRCSRLDRSSACPAEPQPPSELEIWQSS